MKRLVVCIPTYNHGDIVEELLIRCGEIYQKLKIDVYIYDSSENTETRVVVERFQEKYDNLFYVYIDPSVHSNMKVYMIYQRFSSENKYDYIWLCSDALRWSEKTFIKIMEYLEQSYDMLIINHHDMEKLGTCVYNDKNQLFVDCGWITSLYGTTILKLDTILDQVDWNYYIRRYSVPEKINFSHVILYFEQLSRINRVNVVHISIDPWEFAQSPLKKYSGWYKDTFEVWCHFWPVSIMSLPSCYTDENKKIVIKKHGMYAQILTLENFLHLRNDKIFSISIYLKYRKKWKELTDVSPALIFLVSIIPSVAVPFWVKKSSGYGRLKKPVKKFCENYPHIYIYGCGYKAGVFADYLDMLGIQYEGFLVSNLAMDKERFKNHEVKQYSEEIFADPKVGIIMGLNDKNYKEVLKKFDAPSYKKRIFSDYDVLKENNR